MDRTVTIVIQILASREVADPFAEALRATLRESFILDHGIGGGDLNIYSFAVGDVRLEEVPVILTAYIDRRDLCRYGITEFEKTLRGALEKASFNFHEASSQGGRRGGKGVLSIVPAMTSVVYSATLPN